MDAQSFLLRRRHAPHLPSHHRVGEQSDGDVLNGVGFGHALGNHARIVWRAARRQTRGDQFLNRLLRGNQHFAAHMAAFFHRCQLVFEVHAGRARADHVLHQLEGVEHAAETGFGVGHGVQDHYSQTTESFALFTNNTWHVTDQFDLTPDQREIQELARRFTADRITPFAAEWDEKHIFPRDTIKAAAELGFAAIYVSEESGGIGLGRMESALIMEAMAYGCPATSAFISIHNMATWMVATWGQAAVAETWVPALASGEQLASYCLTEPGAGSDAAALRTRAERCGEDYVLQGSKAFISGAGATDLLVVMARTGEDGANGISAFAVPADTPGVVYGKKEHKMGWNSQPTRSISFEGARVPASHRLGAEGEGFRIAMKGLDGGRINIATCSVGAAQGALDLAQRYLRERQQFRRPLAEFQGLQFKLADMATELVAARQMVRLAASKLDRADPQATVFCAMAKRMATDIGFSVCNDALQLHGGYGYIREFPLERLLRDVRVHQILEGTNEIMRVIVARHVLQPTCTEPLS